MLACTTHVLSEPPQSARTNTNSACPCIICLTPSPWAADSSERGLTLNRCLRSSVYTGAGVSSASPSLPVLVHCGRLASQHLGASFHPRKQERWASPMCAACLRRDRLERILRDAQILTAS